MTTNNQEKNKKIQKTSSPYTLGLDIGTTFVGFAAVDDQQRPCRVKGKTVIGVRLFKEAQSAAERKQFRTTRRRLKRRRRRLGLLKQFFKAPINAVDADFFDRLKESNLSPFDSQQQLPPGLFPDGQDAEFYQKYPTIYHLRLALMTEKRQFDLREVYLAIHHIVKYRGNFLSSSPASTFRTGQAAFQELIDRLNQLYQTLTVPPVFQFDDQVPDMLKQLAVATTDRKIDRRKRLTQMLIHKTGQPAIDKARQKMAVAFSKAVLGYRFQLATLLQITPENPSVWTVSFSDEDVADRLAVLADNLNDSQREIIALVQSIYDQLTLNKMIPENGSLSQAMVVRYQRHHDDLRLLTAVCDELPAKTADRIQTAYADYVGKGSGRRLSQAEFIAAVRRQLPASAATDYPALAARLTQDDFMPLQRNSLNRLIPHQLHQGELDRIIENQGRYYPFLKAPNPNPSRRNVAAYQLDELVAFRIPYYVGPLITAVDQAKTSGAGFAWLKRRDTGEITPWNFDQKVDRLASANQFIRQNIPWDNHLLGATVLPSKSLIYQRYLVLDELNAVRVNHSALTVSQKQWLFNDLFKTRKTVTVRMVQEYLKQTEHLPNLPTITGVSATGRFNASLSTYLEFKAIFGDAVADADREAMFERIILYATIFEDRTAYLAKLDQIDGLSETQRKKLLTKNYHGWGRLSGELLTNVKNQAGQSILDLLWQTNRRFQEIQSDADFAKQIMTANTKLINESGLEKVLSMAFLSPQNKKAIRQTMLVVADIVKAIGRPPQKITVHFSKPAVSVMRHERDNANVILRTYQNLPVELVNRQLAAELQETAETHRALSDKLYLYFAQLGRDLVTGKPLKISKIADYQIKHILPETIAYDDTINNQFLTASGSAIDPNKPFVEQVDPKIKVFWRQLRDAKLISGQKYQNLTLQPETLSNQTREHFLKRYLVENNPMTQWVATVLSARYGKQGTRILLINSRLNHQLRQQFNLVRLPEINDYDYGFDAYLTAFIGNYLDRRYPRLRAYFVYGDFSSARQLVFRMSRFNFLYDLTQDEPDELTDWETGEIIWHKSAAVKTLREVYHYKFMLISWAVYTRHDAMFNQTIYPKSDAARRHLIPVKKNRPTKLYGGYSGNIDAYMAIVRLASGQYRVVGVPRRAIDQLAAAKQQGQASYNKTLRHILTPKFIKQKKNRQTGRYEDVIEPFEVVLDKVYYRQLIIDGKQKFRLGSATYQFNAKQLVLSSKARQILSGQSQSDNPDRQFVEVYDEILAKVDRYFDLYDQRRFRELLHAGRERFVSLPAHNVFKGNLLRVLGKAETLSLILAGLHANARMVSLRHLGISSPFGKFQSPKGIRLSQDAELIYQSPSGLFEKRVRLRDL